MFLVVAFYTLSYISYMLVTKRKAADGLLITFVAKCPFKVMEICIFPELLSKYLLCIASYNSMAYTLTLSVLTIKNQNK